MVFKKLVIAVAVFVLFVGGGFTAFQIADTGQDAAADTSKNVTNETIPQQYDVYQFVDKGNKEFTTGFNDSVTVYNASDVELSEGTDYNWNETQGTVEFLDTQKTNESRQANISYMYFENTKAVKDVSGPIDSGVQAIGRTPLMAAGLALVVFLVAFGGFIASRLTNGMPESNR